MGDKHESEHCPARQGPHYRVKRCGWRDINYRGHMVIYMLFKPTEVYPSSIRDCSKINLEKERHFQYKNYCVFIFIAILKSLVSAGL